MRSGVTAELGISGAGEDWFRVWVVREGPGHGAVALAYEGSKVPGSTDAIVVDLLETPLTQQVPAD